MSILQRNITVASIRKNPASVRLLLALGGVVVLFAANLFFGAVRIPASEVWAILTGRGMADSAESFIILSSRLPQAATAALAGAALAVAGLTLQTAFRNPLAGPSILGISSGAGLGVALVMLLFGGTLSLGGMAWGGYAAIVAGAIGGSFAILAILILISGIVRSDLMLLIAGIMVGYLTSSVVTLLSSLATARGIQGYVMWGMGSFSGVSVQMLPLFALLVAAGLVMTLFLAKPLNLLLLGDDYARNLGIGVKRVRNLLLAATGLLTAVVTAWCGPVSFIGLAVPHMARMVMRTDNHLLLIPASMILGAGVALACNVASVQQHGMVIPINALTPVFGVPVILYVILNRGIGR